MSLVTYNGVSLPYPHSTHFEQQAVYDDVSGTDRILTRFDIRVQTYVTSNYLNLLLPTLLNSAGTPLTTNPADIMKNIRNLLLQSRKTLSYKMNGVELLPLTQNATTTPGLPDSPQVGTVDSKNGPIPQSCTITELTNSTFVLTYHIIAHYWENLASPNGNVPSANRTGNDILFNRWSEMVTMDDRMFSTVTRTGKFVIRSDNVDGYIVDQLRSQMAVVGLPQSFLRQRAEYQVTPDGLGLQYTLVDKETYRLPPFPAYRAEGNLFVSLAEFGTSRTVMCHIRLYGRNDANDANRLSLIDAAVGLAVYKVIENGFQILTGAKVDVDLFEPIVDVVVQGMGISAIYGEVLSPGQSVTKVGRFITDLLWKLDTKTIASTKYNVNQGGPGQVGPPQFGGPNTPALIGGNQITSNSSTNIVSPWQPVYNDHGTAEFLLMAASYYDPSLTSWQMNRSYGQPQRGNGPDGPFGPIPGQAGRNLEG